MTLTTAFISIAETQTVSGTQINPNSAPAILNSKNTAHTAAPASAPLSRCIGGNVLSRENAAHAENGHTKADMHSKASGLPKCARKGEENETAVVYIASSTERKNTGAGECIALAPLYADHPANAAESVIRITAPQLPTAPRAKT